MKEHDESTFCNIVEINLPQDQLKQFCQKWKIKEFSIFGSALRGL